MSVRRNLPSFSLLSLSLLVACGPEVLGEESATLDAEGLETLQIALGAGDAVLYGDADATEIHAEVTVWGAIGLPADKAMDSFHFVLEESGDGAAFLAVDIGDHIHRPAWVDVTVTLPASLVVTGVDDGGDFLVEDVAGLDLEDDSGDVTARWIGGDVSILDDSGDILVEGVDGDVVLHDDSGNVTVRDATGDVEIVDDSGDIDVDQVGGTVTIFDDAGDIRIGEVGNLVLAGDDGGEVVINP